MVVASLPPDSLRVLTLKPVHRPSVFLPALASHAEGPSKKAKDREGIPRCARTQSSILIPRLEFSPAGPSYPGGQAPTLCVGTASNADTRMTSSDDREHGANHPSPHSPSANGPWMRPERSSGSGPATGWGSQHLINPNASRKMPGRKQTPGQSRPDCSSHLKL